VSEKGKEIPEKKEEGWGMTPVNLQVTGKKVPKKERRRIAPEGVRKQN